ncbi:Rab proteins geranylgeranyltransferase component A [Rhodotorula mucilaginosa]|uniref:Rab proteins geranylgeranyltransferase component A n=1 Tax=Rhodotorula mucilaginosa TaxID=5537 RepID=A0A9P7B883_RHOMI|nr:Rab proteins geranylgeranyltransferase component A [Rhodotorula mucilaginosa]TKA51487.1 hypothetical protein B0A53_05542 [Rhodotorula sp. CCFEE 5036]
MDPGEPTHFNVLVAGTGLQESILAAALAKAGYSVLQLDSAPYYGTEHASLSLSELHDWALEERRRASTSSELLPDSLARISQRFALSLEPMLLRAQGPGLDLLVRSRVASYLQFGLVGGVGLFQSDAASSPEPELRRSGRVKRVPASKSDVFTDQTLSLVEKRRLTKLLLFAAGQDPFGHDPPGIGFIDYLQKGFSLSGTIADSLAYALALCTSPSDPALPALERIRSIIHAVGRYGPSPYLVGHYGGAGDLVGGFSRICAVWGGGQILGRPILPLELEPEVGPSVPPSQPPFSTPETLPPPPARVGATSLETTRVEEEEGPATATTTRPLGIPVRLEEGDANPTVFTGDWVVSSPHLFSTLFPSQPTPPAAALPKSSKSETAHLIAILPDPIPFPPRASASLNHDDDESSSTPTDADEPDSHLFVFPPGTCHPNVASVTALQTGKGTMSCPEGYYVLYLTGFLLDSARTSAELPDARSLLEPYLEALLALPVPSTDTGTTATRAPPVYSVAYWSPRPDVPTSSSTSPSSPELPLNLLVTPPLACTSQSSSLIETLDEVVPSAEAMFWKIVGEEGRKEGVEFFAKEERVDDE